MRQDSHCYRPPSGNIIPLASDTTLPFGDWFHAVMRLSLNSVLLLSWLRDYVIVYHHKDLFKPSLLASTSYCSFLRNSFQTIVRTRSHSE